MGLVVTKFGAGGNKVFVKYLFSTRYKGKKTASIFVYVHRTKNNIPAFADARRGCLFLLSFFPLRCKIQPLVLYMQDGPMADSLNDLSDEHTAPPRHKAAAVPLVRRTRETAAARLITAPPAGTSTE